MVAWLVSWWRNLFGGMSTGLSTDDVVRIVESCNKAVVDGIRAGMNTEPPSVAQEALTRQIAAAWGPPPNMGERVDHQYIPPHENDPWADGDNEPVINRMFEEIHDETP